jgi:cyclophilin family peptidyl-prolyl cis-trans isomerase
MAARSPLLGLLLAVVLALAACGSSGGGKPAKTPAKASGTPAAAASGPTCRRVAKPKPKGPQHLPKPHLKLDASKTWVADFKTSCGAFQITLDVKHAPETAASFVWLVRHHFYDGLTFHRVAKGFVIQGGDPLGTGEGGPGYSVRETPPKHLDYRHGVVAMAKTQAEPAGTSGSQFFIVTAQDAGITPPLYALVGRVTQGLDVVDTIGLLPTNPPDDGTPLQPVVIDSVTVSSH